MGAAGAQQQGCAGVGKVEGGAIESTEAQPAPGQAESWAILGHLAGLAGHSAPRLAVAAGGEHGGG